MVALIEKKSDLNLIEKSQNSNNIDYSWISVVEKTTKEEQYVKREYTIKPMELSNWIKENLNYIFVRGTANEGSMIYVYSDGYYKYISENEFKGFIKSFIPYQLRKSKDINEIFIDLTTEMKFVDYEELNADEDIINFEDGILNLKTWKLEPHDPKYLSTIQIPAKYKEVEVANATAYNFEKYMMKLCDEDADTYILLLECLGLVISNIYAYRTKKALFLVGEGNTGKSQLKKIAEYLLGKQNVSSIDLKNLSERFGTSDLYQKRLARLQRYELSKNRRYVFI